MEPCCLGFLKWKDLHITQICHFISIEGPSRQLTACQIREKNKEKQNTNDKNKTPMKVPFLQSLSVPLCFESQSEPRGRHQETPTKRRSTSQTGTTMTRTALNSRRPSAAELTRVPLFEWNFFFDERTHSNQISFNELLAVDIFGQPPRQPGGHQPGLHSAASKRGAGPDDRCAPQVRTSTCGRNQQSPTSLFVSLCPRVVLRGVFQDVLVHRVFGRSQ